MEESRSCKTGCVSGSISSNNPVTTISSTHVAISNVAAEAAESTRTSSPPSTTTSSTNTAEKKSYRSTPHRNSSEISQLACGDDRTSAFGVDIADMGRTGVEADAAHSGNGSVDGTGTAASVTLADSSSLTSSSDKLEFCDANEYEGIFNDRLQNNSHGTSQSSRRADKVEPENNDIAGDRNSSRVSTEAKNCQSASLPSNAAESSLLLHDIEDDPGTARRSSSEGSQQDMDSDTLAPFVMEGGGEGDPLPVPDVYGLQFHSNESNDVNCPEAQLSSNPVNFNSATLGQSVATNASIARVPTTLLATTESSSADHDPFYPSLPFPTRQETPSSVVPPRPNLGFYDGGNDILGYGPLDSTLALPQQANNINSRHEIRQRNHFGNNINVASLLDSNRFPAGPMITTSPALGMDTGMTSLSPMTSLTTVPSMSSSSLSSFQSSYLQASHISGHTTLESPHHRTQALSAPPHSRATIPPSLFGHDEENVSIRDRLAPPLNSMAAVDEVSERVSGPAGSRIRASSFHVLSGGSRPFTSNGSPPDRQESVLNQLQSLDLRRLIRETASSANSNVNIGNEAEIMSTAATTRMSLEEDPSPVALPLSLVSESRSHGPERGLTTMTSLLPPEQGSPSSLLPVPSFLRLRHSSPAPAERTAQQQRRLSPTPLVGLPFDIIASDHHSESSFPTRFDESFTTAASSSFVANNHSISSAASEMTMSRPFLTVGGVESNDTTSSDTVLGYSRNDAVPLPASNNILFPCGVPPATAVGNSVGPTPLYNAVSSCAPLHIIQSLIESDPSSLSHQNGGGLTPLHCGIERYDVPINVIRTLLQCDPSTAKIESLNGSRPLDLLWKRYVEPDPYRNEETRRAAFELRRAMELAVFGTPNGNYCDENIIAKHNFASSYKHNVPIPKKFIQRRERAQLALYRNLRLREFWDLMVSFVRAGRHGTIADPLPSECSPWRIVHASVAMGCAPLLVQFAAALHPEELWERDEMGYLPIHIAAEAKCHTKKTGEMKERGYYRPQQQTQTIQDNFVALLLNPDSDCERPCNVQSLLDIDPESAHALDSQGRLPLHIAIASRKPFEKSIRPLFMSFPRSLTAIDAKSRLLPFMFAATGDNPDLNCIYSLLRECPLEVKRGILSTDRRQQQQQQQQQRRRKKKT